MTAFMQDIRNQLNQQINPSFSAPSIVSLPTGVSGSSASCTPSLGASAISRQWSIPPTSRSVHATNIDIVCSTVSNLQHIVSVGNIGLGVSSSSVTVCSSLVVSAVRNQGMQDIFVSQMLISMLAIV